MEEAPCQGGGAGAGRDYTWLMEEAPCQGGGSGAGRDYTANGGSTVSSFLYL